MNAVQRQRTDENLRRLRLFKSRDCFEALLQQFAAEELFYDDFLDTVLGEEIQPKAASSSTACARRPDPHSLVRVPSTRPSTSLFPARPQNRSPQRRTRADPVVRDPF